MSSTQNLTDWWNQFPLALRVITRARFLASIGAGSVLYLSPLVFNGIKFSATEIGIGIASASLIGAISRFISGKILDNGYTFALPVRIAAYAAVIADIRLITAYNFWAYLQGQLLIGFAAGLYWPAVELAIPASCQDFSSKKGFALVRTGDALGVSIGALLGTIVASLDIIRTIYIIDIFCMIFLILLLKQTKRLSAAGYSMFNDDLIEEERTNKQASKELFWIKKLFPVLIISLVCTSILTLLQSALPLDLALGGVKRVALTESWSSGLIACQLSFLVVLQWPIGKWLSKKSTIFGLRLSIISFTLGSLMISLSSLITNGWWLVTIATAPMAIGLAAFLPTATQAVIEKTPYQHRGLGMALFSQCFGLSACLVPLLSGLAIDKSGNGFLLWMTVSCICLCIIPITRLTDK